MSYSVMNDDTFMLRSPGEEQRKLLDQYRLTEIFRDAWGNYMLDHCPEGKGVRDAVAAVKRFKGVDEVDIGQWKDLIIDLMYSERILGFKPWEYFSYGLEDKSIAGRLEFMPNRNLTIYYKVLNANRENFLKLGKKHLTYQVLKPYYKRDMCCLDSDGQRDEFFEFCRRHPRFIIKPAGGTHGKGIEIVNREDYKSPEELFEALRAKGTPVSPTICEELIVCEDSMRAIHPQSVNSVRVYTYLKTNKEVTIIPACWLKVGRSGSVVNNAAVGGIETAIDVETGVAYTDGADESGHVFPAHPDTGFVFKGYQIPRWEELKKMMLEIAPVFPGVSLVGWDVALSKDRGWQLIEGNTIGAINNIQMITKTGHRKQLEAAFEWDIHRVKLQQEK